MIVPAVAAHLGRLAGGTSSSRGLAKLFEEVSEMADTLVDRIEALEHAQHAIHEAGSIEAEARVIVEQVIPAQAALREVADKLEGYVADDLWPLPKYRELLFQY